MKVLRGQQASLESSKDFYGGSRSYLTDVTPIQLVQVIAGSWNRVLLWYRAMRSAGTVHCFQLEWSLTPSWCGALLSAGTDRSQLVRIVALS